MALLATILAPMYSRPNVVMSALINAHRDESQQTITNALTQEDVVNERVVFGSRSTGGKSIVLVSGVLLLVGVIRWQLLDGIIQCLGKVELSDVISSAADVGSVR